MTIVTTIKVGDILPTNNFGCVRVSEYKGYRDVTVVFVETGYTTKTTGSALKSGAITDKEAPSLYGRGILGKLTTGSCMRGDKAYHSWSRMLARCYSKAVQAEAETYKGCTVSEDWLYFPNFKSWFDSNYVDGYELDKDLLKQGNSEYCAEFCVFIPKVLNNLVKNLCVSYKKDKLPTGVRYRADMPTKPYEVRITMYKKVVPLGSYPTVEEASQVFKERKTRYIRDVATAYYKDDVISRDLYKALLQWVV